MMITRCPGCTTSFRVTPDQLKAMQGKVRCGQCQQVFNAIDSLLDMAAEPAPLAESQPDLLDAAPPMGEPFFIDDGTATTIVDEPSAPPEPYIENFAESAWQTPAVEPLLHEKRQTEPRRHTWAWLLATLIALLLLMLQALLQFRIELSLLLPASKPLLQALCAPFACDLPLPSKGDLISIESSDLRPDTHDQAHLFLTATLKNRAPFPQTYPHLELTLTDTADQPILRKVLAPADYLPRGYNQASGFARQGEIPVSLSLAHDRSINAEPTGYRLYIFYP